MPQAVHRTPRMRSSGPEQTQFDVPAVPSVEPSAKLQPIQLLIPVLGSLSILVYGLMARAPVLLVTGGIMALASLAAPIVLHWSGRRAQRAKLARRRLRYREELAVLDAAAVTARGRLASVLGEAHPTPGGYRDWVASNRLWERRLEDDDVLVVRLGTADIPSGFTVNRPSSGSLDAEPDPELAGEVDAFTATAGVLPAAPLCLDLAEVGVLAVAGVTSRAVRFARAIVLELASTCAPDDLGLVVAVPPGALCAWEWAKWLPHTASSTARAGDRRLVSSAEDLERLLGELVAPRLRLIEDGTWAGSREAFPRILVVVDRFDPFTEIGVSPALTRTLERGPEVGVCVLALVEEANAAPTQARALVSLNPDGTAIVRRLREAASPVRFAPAEVGGPEAEEVARFLAPKRLVADSVRSARATSGRLAHLLPSGLLTGPYPDGPVSRSGSEEALAWPYLGPRDLLRIPFAVSADGTTLQLDLKESAEGGCGPHGLVVGAVGSGKSELLRTVVAALAATHSPDDVELAFVDFKGGLTFTLLHDIPHCSGMITNLTDDLSLVDRMKAALVGELERRQQLLRAAGKDVQKIGQYRALRERQAELPPMPFLMVVVDEFGELLEARPDVLDVLLSIGRTGRSLGVHLVLASQRLELGRVRGLDSYLGYRICLRTFTAEDSMAVLGTRAAADLPALPGHGYLRTADGLVRFLAATVSGPRTSADAARTVRPFLPASVGVTGVAGNGRVAGSRDAAADIGSNATAASDVESDLAVVVRRAGVCGSGRERRRLWLPPLPGPGDPGRLTLSDDRLRSDLPPPAVGLPVPVGLVDLPRIRSQVPLCLDPAALDGHLLVVGAPRSGKSTVLAAYAAHAVQVHPAPLLQFHVVDLGGGALAPLADLPNVASYVDGQDPEGVRRVILELERIVEEHPALLRRARASGPAAWRAMVAAGTAEGPAHTVLLLDQLTSFRDRFPDLDALLGRLVAEGPSAGVHLAMTSTRWAELPPKRLEQVSTRIELHLNDPMESLYGRVRAAAVPGGVPGRGLAGDGSLVQIACPDSVDGRTGTVPDLRAGVRVAARRARERWPGVAAERLRRLVDLTDEDWSRARSDRPALAGGGERGALLGVDEADYRAVVAEPSGLTLLAYGDAGSGRTRFLTRLLTDVVERPEGAHPQVYVLDYLGALLDGYSAARAESANGSGSGGVVAAAYGPQQAPDVLGALTDELTRRQVGTAAARRAGDPADTAARPPLWLVVDDYELVHAAARPGLVSELAGLVPYAARLGLNVVVAQGANGSGARVDPLVRRILEGSPWHLQFSVESRTELLLRGTRGVPLPPGQALLARPGRPDRLLAVLPPLPAPDAGGARAADAAHPHIRLVS